MTFLYSFKGPVSPALQVRKRRVLQMVSYSWHWTSSSALETPRANACSIVSKRMFPRGTEKKKELDFGLRQIAPKHWLLHLEQTAQSFWVLVFSSLKWGCKCTFKKWLWGLNEVARVRDLVNGRCYKTCCDLLVVDKIVRFCKPAYSWPLAGCRTEEYQHRLHGRLKWLLWPLGVTYLSILVSLWTPSRILYVMTLLFGILFSDSKSNTCLLKIS